MTWFAVPNDLIGGWCVANRQVQRSDLDTRPKIAKLGRDPHMDVVIADGVKSEADARRIAAALNYIETTQPDKYEQECIVDYYSVPWPDRTVEGS